MKLKISDMMDNVTSTTVEINETENISTDRIKKRTMEMLHSEGQQTRPAKRFSRVGIVAAIFAASLCVSASAIAVIHRFHNDILISDFSEIPKASNNTSDSTVAISGPNGSAPHSLEDIIKESQITAEEWDNGERIGGGTSFAYATWDTASLISNNPALRTRLVTRTDGAEKTEYMTENDPSILLSELTGKIKFDLTWMGKNYTSVPCANIAYVIRESDGAFVGEYFDALYSASDDKGYMSFDISYDVTRHTGQSYIVDGAYEKAYYYTTANGYEFLITANKDSVWAECYTDYANINLYGAYLTTDDVEEIVEQLDLSISEYTETK